MPTAQEIFDKSVGKLLQQGKRSANTLGRCFYRSENGCCAVGHLIPDELYQPEMDRPEKDTDTSVRTLVKLFPKVKEHILPSDMTEQEGILFLNELQRIHDFDTVAFWSTYYGYLAKKYNLEYKFQKDVDIVAG